MDYSLPGSPVLYCLPEFVQTHFYWVGDAIEPSHLLTPPPPFAFSLGQHQGLFQCKKYSWQFDRDCTKSVNCLGSCGHFNSIDFSYPRAWYIFLSVCVVFNFFHQCLIVQLTRAYVSICVCVCIYIYTHTYIHVCSVSSVMSDSLQPKDFSPPGSSVHGILQARILEWVAMPSSRGSSWLRDWMQLLPSKSKLP